MGALRADRKVLVDIPSVVIDRLPLYVQILENLETEGQVVVSSQELGNRLGVTPAQIRKDLSYFGRFGKQGRGYSVSRLLEELRRILGLDRSWQMTLVGVGRLGRAILGYEGFAPKGFRIVSAFDFSPSLIGSKIGDLVIQDVADLEAALAKSPVEIGIVAVPAQEAQAVIDSLVRSNVRAILNYAPIAAHVPSAVELRRIDPVLALQSMTYYLKQGQPLPASSGTK
ncbi:MAG TPA: redox-sensing transcriptional repressor Rex [Dehalococcoidia bacterium]|nr:redox-sensing transcriptional repressor Rex [Dehalococcoidia bacterium]